ncbi:hypothetical protein BGZ73_004299 [Actinomortierella ambigua]|nr:hypothetical protein BGZ73_004299 [Actinomortierella ambigua]
MATGFTPHTPPPASPFPPHIPEQPDVAVIRPPMMANSVVERRDLLGNILPLNPKSPDTPAAGEPAASSPPPSSSPPAGGGGGGSAASVPPPPVSPTDPNHPKAVNSGVLPGLLNGVLGNPPPPGTTSGAGSPQAAPTGVGKQPVPATKDTNGDGIPDNQQSGSSQDDTSASNDTAGSSNGGDLSPGVIALIVLFTLAILGALGYSCYRICDARRRRRTRRFDDEDILRNHAGSVGYSAGGGYGVYMEKERNDLWGNLDIFNRR